MTGCIANSFQWKDVELNSDTNLNLSETFLFVPGSLTTKLPIVLTSYIF